MSKHNKKEKTLKFCVYCGAKLKEGETYCPECGKLVIKIKPSNDKIQTLSQVEKPQIKEKKVPSRKCSGCGSIITSSILEQCPICNAKLEKIPRDQTTFPSQKALPKSGFIFTDKKLVPEQKFILKKDTWNFREGISVFGNCIMAYIIIRLLIIMIFAFQVDGSTASDVNIFSLLLRLIPDIIFGVYPLWYIYSKKHNIKKLGLSYNLKIFLLAIFIGVTAGILLLILNLFSDVFINLLYNAGIDFYDIYNDMAITNQVIKDSNPIWILLLMGLLSLSSFSTEIVYRGVLHNTLKERFERDILGRITIIIIISLIFSGLYLIFFFPVGLYLFLANFIEFIILGIIYEINHNLYNTIIASIFYNLLLVLIIVYS